MTPSAQRPTGGGQAAMLQTVLVGAHACVFVVCTLALG